MSCDVGSRSSKFRGLGSILRKDEPRGVGVRGWRRRRHRRRRRDGPVELLTDVGLLVGVEIVQLVDALVDVLR